MPSKEAGPSATPPRKDGPSTFPPSREASSSLPNQGHGRRDRQQGIREATEELRHKVEPAVEQIVGEPVARVTGEFIHGTGEVIGQAARVEGFIEETAEISSEGGIVLLQKGIAFGDKHIPGFTNAREKFVAGIEKLHSKFIDWRAQSMVDHPKRFYNRIAIHTMLKQTVKESGMNWAEKWQKDHPLAAKLARSPLTAAEIASLLPLWIPTPLRNPFIPLPMFINQLSTLVAVNARRALLGLTKMKPLEFGIYGAFAVLDLVAPLFNAYPIAPGIDAYVSAHYHKRRRRFIEKVGEKITAGGLEAEELRAFLEPRVLQARKATGRYRSASNLEEFTQQLHQQRATLSGYQPTKAEHSDTWINRKIDAVRKTPIVSIPVHAVDLLTDVRHHLELLKWKGKMESVDELESLVKLFLPQKSLSA